MSAQRLWNVSHFQKNLELMRSSCNRYLCSRAFYCRQRSWILIEIRFGKCGDIARSQSECRANSIPHCIAARARKFRYQYILLPLTKVTNCPDTEPFSTDIGYGFELNILYKLFYKKERKRYRQIFFNRDKLIFRYFLASKFSMRYNYLRSRSNYLSRKPSGQFSWFV